MASNRKFNVPINLLSLASDPASADEGDVYYNTTDDRIRVYKNSTWVNLAYADDVGIVSTDYITFDTTPEATIPATAGTVSWDSGESGLNVTLNSNVDLKLGQENVVLVANQTGSSIPKGSVVYINGAAGQRPTITLADADAESSSSKTLGITAEAIADTAEGFVTTFGVLRGVNTDGLTEGAMLWLSSTAGGYTTTVPAEPAHSVFVGYVVKASSSAGEIFVNVQNGYELDELHGVSIEASGSLTDNEVLAYDTASGLWKNQTSAEAGLIDTSSTAQTKTGNFTSSGDIAAGGVLKSTASSANEGGQIELSTPSSGTTLSGTNVTIDVYQDKLRFFESGGTNRGAYIPLTSAGAAVGTSLLGGTTGAMNYAQTMGTKQTNISSAGTTIVSVSFTTNGYPVQVLVTGDVENNSAGGWTTLQLYRDSTAIGNIIHTEGSAGSENAPFSLTTIDAPSAGTYTYALKLNSASGGTFNFGESNGPVITVIELSGPKGDTGATGSSPNAFTTIATTSGTSPVADSSTDTLTLSAGTGITITGDSSTDTITIASTITDTNTTYDLTTSGTSTATVSLAGSDATTDSFTITGGGATTVSHSAGAITISSTDTNTTYTASNGVTLSGTDIQHADTSTQSSVNNSGNTFIQDITLDGYGHITNINSGTVSFSSYAALAGATFTGDVSGTNITLSGDIAVNGGDITTTNTTATLFNTTATTLSIGGAATTFNIGTASNTNTTINIGPTGTSLATINIGNSAFDTAISIGTGVGTASDITIGSSTYTTLGLRGSTINIVGGAVVNGELSSNGTTDTLDSTNNGFYFSSADQFTFAASITAGDTTPVMRINRNTSDGNILRFAQAGTVEGTVSVSGTTVTYGTFAGIHWSQFANHAKPEILPGTVLETIDEMCDWQKEDGTYEDNDQLPKVKVSDNNESSSVYGVFMTWDGEDEYNDMHVLSLGAWLCRIDANETVQIGDLLVSAGNGCAKVQSDDIIRSKTIGKVTSTIRHSTYEDGSYLVPTVFYCG